MSKLASDLYTNKLESEVNKLKDTLTDYHKLHKGQLVKLIVLDFGVPISLSVLALYRNYDHLLPFIQLVLATNA